MIVVTCKDCHDTHEHRCGACGGKKRIGPACKPCKGTGHWTVDAEPEPADAALLRILDNFPLGLSEVGILQRFPEDRAAEMRDAIAHAEHTDILDFYRSDDDPPWKVYLLATQGDPDR